MQSGQCDCDGDAGRRSGDELRPEIAAVVPYAVVAYGVMDRVVLGRVSAVT
jgi:hypothetical protein